jgi:imidazolonepropionase-like amidohydrolase
LVADLVLLEADPLRDIRKTTKVRAVIAKRRLYDRRGLDAILA